MNTLPEQKTKPPIGLKPQSQWHRERRHEIHQAMERYIEAGQYIPIEWVYELKRMDELPF